MTGDWTSVEDGVLVPVLGEMNRLYRGDVWRGKTERAGKILATMQV